MLKYFTVRLTALYEDAEGKKRILDLPPQAILEVLAVGERFIKVRFEINARVFTGWVASNVIDPVPFDEDNSVKLHGQTPSQQDAEQYLSRAGKTWFNLCGQLCVTYLLEPERDFDHFLVRWKAVAPKVYQRIFANGLSSTTSLPDVMSMIAAYEAETALTSTVPILTPARLKAQLEKGYALIVGVKINYAGKIKPFGILHWVAVLDVVVTGVMDGMVRFYNPFPNGVRWCSWDEFIDSTKGVLFGVFVKLP